MKYGIRGQGNQYFKLKSVYINCIYKIINWYQNIFHIKQWKDTTVQNSVPGTVQYLTEWSVWGLYNNYFKKKLSLSSKGLNLLAIYKYLYTFYILLYRFIINCILACQKNILVLSEVRSIIQRNEICVNVKE